MNIVISLDYEVYFGRRSGSVEGAVLAPSQALCHLAAEHCVPLVFFVDAAWLLRLREEGRRHPALMAEHDRVMRQLQRFADEGHELQLHVHPHWRDSHWADGDWKLDLRRYRLHEFDDAEIVDIVQECTQLLRSVAGRNPVSAYRAGGWCIQPFQRLRPALRQAGIRIDSTVYAGGVQQGEGPWHDFTHAPPASRWRFEHDPLRPDETGSFLEVPIASHRVGPAFYWRLALMRKLKLRAHSAPGGGEAMRLSRADLARKLLRPTTSVVSIDGLKASFLEAAFAEHQRRGSEDFVIIGHPKALTRYSMGQLDQFLRRHKGERFVGLNHYLQELPARAAQDAPHQQHAARAA